MIKLVSIFGKSKWNFLSGERIRFPFPWRCPFCKAPGHLCLIRWGFYTVKAKRYRGAVSAGTVLYIQRFYCKNTGKTFSRLPDCLHTRKGYAQDIVSDVFDAMLEDGKGICATAQEFTMPYQTIQHWLKGLSRRRQGKAVCFSESNSLDGFFHVSVREWCVRLWHILKRRYGGAREKALIAATRAVLAGARQPLY